MNTDINDNLWKDVVALLPPAPVKPKGGRPSISDRIALAGIVWVLQTGKPWKDIPAVIGGSGMTCLRRLRDWQNIPGGTTWICIEKLLRKHLPRASSLHWYRVKPLLPHAFPRKRAARRTTTAAVGKARNASALPFGVTETQEANDLPFAELVGLSAHASEEEGEAAPIDWADILGSAFQATLLEVSCTEAKRQSINLTEMLGPESLESLESDGEAAEGGKSPIDLEAILGPGDIERLMSAVEEEAQDQKDVEFDEASLYQSSGSEERPEGRASRLVAENADDQKLTISDLIKVGFRPPSDIEGLPQDAEDRNKIRTAGDHRAWELRASGWGEPARPTRILPGLGPQGGLLRAMTPTPWQDEAMEQSSRPEIYVQHLPKPKDFYYGGRHGPVRQRLLTNDFLKAPLPAAFLGWKDFKRLHDALYFAYRQGLVMNATVTVAWFLLKPYGLDLTAQEKAFERFRRDLARWFGLQKKGRWRHGIDGPGSHFVWVHENPHPAGEKFHTHLLIHVPPDLAASFKEFLPMAVARAAGLRHGLPAEVLAKRVRRPDHDALYGQWRWFHYVTKGTKPHMRLPAQAGLNGHRLEHVMHHGYQNPGAPPAGLGVHYVGCTHSLSPRGRQTRCAETKEAAPSVLSAQCRTGQIDIRRLYPGYEHGPRRGPLKAQRASLRIWQGRAPTPGMKMKGTSKQVRPTSIATGSVISSEPQPVPIAEQRRGRQFAPNFQQRPTTSVRPEPRKCEDVIRSKLTGNDELLAGMAQESKQSKILRGKLASRGRSPKK
ncbi:transposase [Roseomonas haemaphysalidis]|uniref:transposase n=1 Tax=Roseomonas haemaphysalidis TaxID=2768162 RepID=UPI001A95B4E1